MHYDYIFPHPSSINFGFNDIDTWRQSGKFPVGRVKLKITQIPRIKHMSRLNFFMKLYFMEYIKDVVIHETNKRINSDINLSEYFSVISCRLIMDFYVGYYVR